MPSTRQEQSSARGKSAFLSIADAVASLRAGGVVAIPTDTVYGLAASAFDERAVARVYRVKGRDFKVALPVLMAEPDDIDRCAVDVPDVARRLVEAFWPGPLTIIVCKSGAIPDALSAGMPTVGLRVPDHPVPRELSRLLGSPITGTSANRSGAPSLSTAAGVLSELGDSLDGVVDGGELLESAPSTVVDLVADPPRIVRPGAITADELSGAVGVEFLPA